MNQNDHHDWLMSPALLLSLPVAAAKASDHFSPALVLQSNGRKRRKVGERERENKAKMGKE